MARGVGLGGVESTVPAEEGLRRPSLEYRGPSTGAALAGVAQDAGALNAEIQKRDASSYAALQVPQAHVAAESAFLDAQQQPKDVIDKAGGFTPYVMKQFQQFADGAAKGAPNPLGQRMMREHLASVGASLQMRSLEADADAQKTRRIAQATDGMTAAATAAQLNPDAWKDIGAQQIQAYEGMGVDDVTRTKLGQQMDAQVRAAAGRGYADKDPASVLNRLNDKDDDLFQHFDLKEREAIQGYAKDKLAGNEADGIVNYFRSSNDAYAGAANLKAFNDNPNIPFDVKQVAQDKIRQGVGLWQQEQRDRYKDTIIGLEDRIGSGQATLADRGTVLAMGQRGVYQPDRVGTMLGEIDRQQKKKVDDTVNLFNAQQAYKNSSPMDPSNKDAKDGINQLFNSTSAPIGSQEWTNLAADISRKTGVTPSFAIENTRARLISGSVDDRVAASDTFKRLQDANPRGIGYAVEPKDAALASNINKFVSAGADPVKAVERADQLSQIDPAEEKRYQEMYDKKTQGQSLNALSARVKDDPRLQDAGLFGTGMLTHTPTPPPAMQGEFEQLSRSYFPLTGGDAKQARDLAYEDLKHQWGVTEVNGQRELMRYAPEVMNPGLTTPFLRDDMQKAATASGVTPEFAAKAHLTPDSEATYHSQGQLWNISVPDKNGLYDAVRGANGRPLIYALPSAAESHAATVTDMKQKGLQEARRQIDQEHQNQKDLIEQQQQAAANGGLM